MKHIVLMASFIIITTANQAVAEFLLGVGTHIFQQNLDKDMQATKTLGINSIRDDLNWAGNEKEKGKRVMPKTMASYLHDMNEANIVPLLVLAYGNPIYHKGKKPTSPDAIAAFASYASFSATHAEGDSIIFEIWNEWDQAVEPTSPESYLQIVRATASAIKNVNRKAIVLAGAATTGGMRNGWVESLVRLGVLDYVDGISIHPYIYCDRKSSPEAWAKLLLGFSTELQRANGGKDVPLYITETGWPTNSGTCGITPEEAGNFAARVLFLTRTIRSVHGLWWYDLKNDGRDVADREHNFGLLTYDYQEKPAFRQFSRASTFVVKGSSFSDVKGVDPLRVVAFVDQAGKKAIAAWVVNEKAESIYLNSKDDVTVYSIASGSTAKAKPINGVVKVDLDDTVRVIMSGSGVSINRVGKP